MKTSIILLLVALVGVFAQLIPGTDTVDGFNQVKSWSGNLANSPNSFKAPVFVATPASCNPAFANTTYYAVQYSFTTAGVRQIALMASQGFGPFVQAVIYTNFNPGNPCANGRQLTNGNFLGDSGIFVVNDPFYFAAGTTYTIVVTSTSVTTTGQFALSILGSNSVGTTVGQPNWVPASATGTGCVSSSLAAAAVNVYQFTSPATALYDILVMFENIGQTANQINQNSVSFALYQGTVSAADLAANSCPASGIIKISANEADLETAVLAYQLQQNLAYTVAVSNNRQGNYAVQITPTRVIPRTNNAYQQPNRSPISPCAGNSSASNAGKVLSPVITAQYNRHFFDTYVLPSYNTFQSFQEETFVYQGAVTDANPVPACPSGATLLAAVQTGANRTGNAGTQSFSAQGPIAAVTVVGTQYTLVISTLDGSSLSTPPASPANAQWASQLFILAGNSLDPAAATTTTTTVAASTATTTTTSTATTGTTTAPATGVPTTGTSTTQNTTQTTSTSTSGAPTSTSTSTSGTTSSGTTQTPTTGTTTQTTATGKTTQTTTTTTTTNSPTGGVTGSTTTTSGAATISFSAFFVLAAFLALF